MLPHNPQTMEGLSQRSRSKETQLFFSWALEDSELYSTAQKLGRNTKTERFPEPSGRAELKHHLWGVRDEQDRGKDWQTDVCYSGKIHAS